jgi:DNA-binding transcriptional LysR family regulator
VELRQLEYFAAVARHRNFTRAADELYLTQSALSQQVRRLEAELGLELLRRTPAGVALTSAGADLLARADRILAEVAQARAEMDEHAGVMRGVVRIATAAADARGLAQALADFHRGHPGIRVALRQGSTAEALALLRSGSVDIALVAIGSADTSGLRAAPLADERLLAVAAPDDALGATGEVAIADLRGRPLILAEPGSALRDTVVDACQAAGWSPVPLFEIGDPATVRRFAHAGLGVSVVPASWVEGPGPAVAVARLTEPAPRHRLSLVVPAAGLSPAGRLLHEQLRIALGGSDDAG